MAAHMIRVLIADDHEIVRRGLRMTIEAEPDLELVGEAQNGRQVIELAQRLAPQVILMDIQMPEMDGIAATQVLRAREADLPILMLTSFSTDAQLYRALQAGASGYLLKDMNGDALCAAIRGAAAGRPQLHPEIARRLMAHMATPDDPFGELTPRELDVLQLIARGNSNKEIGLALGVSELTVKGYVSTVLSKLGVADRTQAALLAVRYGLLNLDDLPAFPAL